MKYFKDRMLKKNWLELFVIALLFVICVFILSRIIPSIVHYEDFNAEILSRRPETNLTVVWSGISLLTVVVLADVWICFHWFDNLDKQ